MPDSSPDTHTRRWTAALALCLAASLGSAALAQTAPAATPPVVAAPATPADSAPVADPAGPTDAGTRLEQVRAAFQARFPDTDVVAVRTTDYPGLFELQVGVELLYTDASVSYLLHGTLVDAATRIDRTAERQLLLARDAFAQLPMKWAITQVKGDGSRQMAVFEDPNCGYCKQLHRTLAQVDNLTIHTFLYPILTPDSTVKARNIWCAKDRVAAWTDWMQHNKVPGAATCETPLDELAALAQGLMVRGTPAIFMPDGTRFNGAAPLEALTEALNRQTATPSAPEAAPSAKPATGS